MAITSDAVVQSMLGSIASSKRSDQPYTHWNLSACLPADVEVATRDLPFEAPALGGVSGKRELHNATRKYFDEENRKAYPVCEAVAQAFQSRELTDRIASYFGTDLKGTYLRIEFAQDTNGFWLEPHTDLGVKVFTMLLYLSTDPTHANLGTDIYDNNKAHIGRSPFVPNGALVFIPGNDTYHGFEPREIQGVRKSVIINYVTNEWRAREQLAFPSQPL